MSLSIYNYTGFHTEATEKKEKLKARNVCTYNGIHVLGYLPVGGILTGIMSIAGGVSNESLPTSTRIYLVVRGIFDIIGLGLLFLIPDLIVSAHRHFCTENPQAQKA